MTSRTDDYRCRRCGKYLFSAYTVHMSREERAELDRKARVMCKCEKPAPVSGVALPDTTAMQFKLIDAKNALQNAAQYAPPEVAEVYRQRAFEVAEVISALSPRGVAACEAPSKEKTK
jgi:hypothetical protein